MHSSGGQYLTSVWLTCLWGPPAAVLRCLESSSIAEKNRPCNQTIKLSHGLLNINDFRRLLCIPPNLTWLETEKLLATPFREAAFCGRMNLENILKWYVRKCKPNLYLTFWKRAKNCTTAPHRAPLRGEEVASADSFFFLIMKSNSISTDCA